MKSKSMIPIIKFASIGIILIALLVGNIFFFVFNGLIGQYFGAGTTKGASSEILAASDELVQTLEGDGIVLLKNENNCLPLDKNAKNINVFGWGATNAGFLLRGQGSGSSTISAVKRVELLDALSDAGYVYNNDIINMYKSFNTTDKEEDKGNSRSPYIMYEPGSSYYTASLMQGARNHSDTALVVLSRNGGENVGEIPTNQGGASAGRTYMELSVEEENLLDLVCDNFEKVIVLLNTANTMHCGFLENDKIDAAFYVGLPGQSGARAIPKILNGEINPSGKVTDTYTYSPVYDPTYVNREQSGNNIQYQEDIYYGYKWYETADAEHYFDDIITDYGSGYDGIVQFPFGSGLSYSKFSWEIIGTSLAAGSNLTKDSIVKVAVRVTNNSDVAGKEVVEIYNNPPYTPGGIEKAHVNLLDFTKVLVPANDYRDVELSFSAYSLAAYDAYDKNGDGNTGYELEAGEYNIMLMKNSHTLAYDNSIIKYHVASTILFDKDTTTGTKVDNVFTGSKAYADVPIDGSTVGCPSYMTRADFNGTFPKAHASNPTNSSLVTKANNFLNPVYDQTSMPKTGIESNLRLVAKNAEGTEFATKEELASSNATGLFYNEKLISTLADDFEDDAWEALIDQMTISEMFSLIQLGNFRTIEIASIGKTKGMDYDGPAGFSRGDNNSDKSGWTAFPSATLMGSTWNKELCFMQGLSMGVEGKATTPNKLTGWYAPGVQLHRSNYTARNYEYYSEDGVLSGKLAASVIIGAKTNGLYCYLKHYALSEPGPNPHKLNTWITEQNLRENYLRPFEIAVKEGGANGIMSAFNNVGGSWSGASYPLLTTILREEWGFRGTVITDWADKGLAGIGAMSMKQGIRCGNDLWLSANATGSETLTISSGNATEVYCAKLASKNIVYTFVDTYNYAKLHAGENYSDVFKVDLVSYVGTTVFPWWNVAMIIFDVIGVAGLGFWAFVITKKLLNGMRQLT